MSETNDTYSNKTSFGFVGPVLVRAQNYSINVSGQVSVPAAADIVLPTVVKCSILVVLVLVNFAGNGLTIEAIRTTRRLRTKTNFLVGGLAVSDLAVGLMEAFHITWNLVVYVVNAGLCRFRFILAIAPPSPESGRLRSFFPRQLAGNR